MQEQQNQPAPLTPETVTPWLEGKAAAAIAADWLAARPQMGRYLCTHCGWAGPISGGAVHNKATKPHEPCAYVAMEQLRWSSPEQVHTILTEFATHLHTERVRTQQTPVMRRKAEQEFTAWWHVNGDALYRQDSTRDALEHVAYAAWCAARSVPVLV